jgi:3-isopropylmalate/(R)-2-methylmalate dehydratase large subunit/3-isopropylmalate/(R)-2-methylmalate dehydratase small subunit
MELDLSEGRIYSGGRTFECTKLPQKMQEILDRGGLIASLDV